MARVSEYLSGIAAKKLPLVHEWVNHQLREISESGVKPFILGFSLSPRKFSKNDLVLDEEDKLRLHRVFNCFYAWNEQNFARLLLLVRAGEEFPDIYKKGLDQILSTASLEEQLFLLRVLFYLPHGNYFVDRASEGIRSNSTAVFDAIVLDNPYPEKYLNDHSWNQMVLKAVFMGRPLYRILGIDRRMNKELAIMLQDLVKERSAANRKITPEAWRLLGAYLQSDMKAEVQKLASTGDKFERMAAILACSSMKSNFVDTNSPEYASLMRDINENSLTWDVLGKIYEQEHEKSN